MSDPNGGPLAGMIVAVAKVYYGLKRAVQKAVGKKQ